MRWVTGRWWRSWWATDAMVAAVVAGLSGADLLWNAPGTRADDGWTWLLLAMAVAALLGRRRWPMAVALLCGLVTTGWVLLGHRGELLHLAPVVALYTVAAQGNRRRSVVVAAVAVVWSGLLGWWAAEPPSAPVTELLWPVVALLLGEVVRMRRQLVTEYAAREARLAAEREREAHRRVQGERVRIAREFHDVVAHTMAAVNVQMGVVAAAWERSPETARSALRQARAAGRDALAELRAVVRLLREDPGGGPAGPSPGLDRFVDLVAGVRQAGVQVVLEQQDYGEVPAGTQVAAYRIVQEALTNVIRHARAKTVTVLVARTPAAVVVEVVDDGIGAAPATAGADGYGLVGMAERAAAIGGSLTHGPVPGGGFRVRAYLPVRPDRAIDGRPS